MSKIRMIKTEVDGLYILEPTVFEDERGYFLETYNKNDMREVGLDIEFVQDNQSMSKKGVLRGLHYQKQFPQGKLIRVIRGEIFDVAVDMRMDSCTYVTWYGVILSEKNRKQFYISEGFAHGFLVLSEVAELCYKVTDYYHPNDEDGIIWNDPDIGIKWPNVIGDMLRDGTKLVLSDKDKSWKRLCKINN